MHSRFTILTLILILFTVPMLAQDGPPPPPELTGDIVIEGLNGPQGLYIAEDGTLYVVDSGFGGDEETEFVNPNTFETEPATFGITSQVVALSTDGEQSVVAMLPSIAVGQDFLGGARLVEVDGTLYVTVGVWISFLGDEVTIDNYSEVVSITDGEVTSVADFWAHELENNPDETTNLETHPYGIAAGSDGLLYVADAAANALISVDPATGETATVAAFDGLPGVFPNPFRGGEAITDPVPTGVITNEDGSFLVSLLSGAPFIPGSASIMQVSAEGEISMFAPGLTMVTDVTRGPDGNLYAVQFGMFTQEGPVPNSGSVVRIMEDGTSELVIDGLPFATAIAIDADGNGYVAINGIAIPNAGAVVYYEGLTGMEGTAMPEMAPPGPPPATTEEADS